MKTMRFVVKVTAEYSWCRNSRIASLVNKKLHTTLNNSNVRSLLEGSSPYSDFLRIDWHRCYKNGSISYSVTYLEPEADNVVNAIKEDKCNG